MKIFPASRAKELMPCSLARLLAGFPTAALGLVALAALVLGSGCEAPAPIPSAEAEQHNELTLREGDVIKISFPGAPNLDVAPQPIRRDGKISMPILGEISTVA